MERGRSLTEKFREEIIINKRIKKNSDFCIDESRIEQQIVMPYKFLALVLIYSSSCVLVYMLTLILYMSVLEARISAIMRMGNFNIY